MGAGAGYTIYVDNSKISNVNSVEVISIDHRHKYKNYTEVVANCYADVVGDVRAESYYYGCDWIKRVPMVLTQIKFAIDGVADFMTVEAIEKYENQFGVDDVMDVYTEVEDVLTPEDVNTDFIVEKILRATIGGEGAYGGGWTRNNFDGEFTLNMLDDQNGFDIATELTLVIKDEMVNSFIEKAVYGENIDYNIWFDGDPVDGSDDEDDAIQMLKSMIDEAIEDGTIDDIDLSECYVLSEYYQLMNAEGEIDYVDLDRSEEVYSADKDSDYDDIYEDEE